MAMVVAALFEGKLRLASAILLSVVGLLRVGENVGATRRQFGLFGGGSLLALTLPDSKGTARKGVAEQTSVYDLLVLKLAHLVFNRFKATEVLGTHAHLVGHTNFGAGRTFGMFFRQVSHRTARGVEVRLGT